METRFDLARAVVDEIKRIQNERMLVFWGGWEPEHKLKQELVNDYHIEFGFYLTIMKNKVSDKNVNKDGLKPICYTDVIKNKADKFFIIAFVRETDEYIKKFLELGYVGGKDILFIYPKPFIVTKDYQDWRGNIVKGIPKNCSVKIAGFANKLSFKNVICLARTVFNVGSFSKIVLNQTKIEAETTFLVRDLIGGEKHPELLLDENCILRGGSFAIYSGSFKVERNCTFGKNLHVTVGNGMSIQIKQDCMFSHDIWLLSGDGHSLYDVKTGKCMNDPSEMPQKKKEIVLGEHVWIGLRCTLLNGTVVGNGSMVGANSLVKGEFTNNCIIAGTPSKMIKRDIAWSREPVCTDIQTCGEEYICLSQ